MRISSRRFVQVGVLIIVTIALALSAQAATYGKASLKGSYSFLTDLWTANATTTQYAMVGILTFDGAGAVTGSYTSISSQVFRTGTLGLPVGPVDGRREWIPGKRSRNDHL